MANTVIAASLSLDSSQATTSVKNFKTQLREASANLVQIQEQFGATSTEALQAARGVAALRDRIQEAREVTELFDPGARFQVFGNVLRTVVGGVTALTGAMALFGEESKEVQNALLKVQSALALTEGLNTIVDAAKDFQRLKDVAIDAFKGIKAAIGSTGIGLIVIAIGLLVTYFDEIKEALFGINKEQTKALELATKLADKEKERLTHIDDQDNILKQQGKTEKQILEIKEKQIQSVIKASEAQLQAQKNIEKLQIETAQRNHDILAGILQFIEAPIRGVAVAIDAINAGLGKNSTLAKTFDKYVSSQADLLFDPKAVKEKAAKADQEAQDGLNKLKNTYAGYQLQIKAINKEAAEKEAAFQAELKALRDAAGNALITDTDLLAQRKLKQDYENQQKSIKQEVHTKEQRTQLLTALEEKYQNESAALSLSKIKELNDKIKIAENEKYEAKKTADKAGLDGFLKSGTETINALKDKLSEVNAETKSSIQGQYDESMKAVNQAYYDGVKGAEGNAAELLRVTREYEEAKAKIEQIRRDAYINQTSEMLGAAMNLFGKNTIAFKAIAIAKTTIDTFQAGFSAFKGMVSAIPGPIGIAAGIVAAAGAVATGLATVKKIVAVQIPGVSGGSGGASISAPTAPLTPQVSSTQLPQDQINQIGQAGNQTAVRSFVVESDITNSQERIERLNRQARLGN